MDAEGFTLDSTLTLIVVVTSIAAAIYVFGDAHKRGMSAGWGIGALALWIVVLPVYLIARSGREVGQGAASAPITTAPPNWYLDPEGGPGWRWWDGRQWTEHRSGAEGPSQAKPS
ncbi:hypothetical protein BH24ACT25_BH24ACT25_04760 [soil metagenome]